MIGDSSIKNFHCMLNLNKFGEGQKYVCGSSDHPMMPSINDLLYASKKEIESINTLYSILQPNSSLESLMSNCEIVSSLQKKYHLSNHKIHWNGHRKKKNSQNRHRRLNYFISTDESVQRELAQLERVIENQQETATDENSQENNNFDLQNIISSISRRRAQQETSNVEIENDDDLSGIFSSSSSNSSRNSTSHSSNRERNENNENTDSDEVPESASSSSSDDEDEPLHSSSNQDSVDASNDIIDRLRMWRAIHRFAEITNSEMQQDPDTNQNEAENNNIDEEISNNNTSHTDDDDFIEEYDHDTFDDEDDEDEDNYEDISAIFDSVQEPRDEPSPLHTIHANTAVISATAQLTPAGETDEIISSINELPDSLTDIIEDEINDEIEKDKKKTSNKKTKKAKKSGLPIPDPMTLEEAFDFISFVKKEASKTSNDIENDTHSHNRSKKKASNARDNQRSNLCFC